MTCALISPTGTVLALESSMTPEDMHVMVGGYDPKAETDTDLSDAQWELIHAAAADASA